MPYLSGPGCVLGDCEPPLFPQLATQCVYTLAVGGISELYFIPCTETFTEVNVTDPYWWANLVDTGVLGRSGPGLGKIAKKSTKQERTASCNTEQVTSVVWALNFVKKYFDKTSARQTCAVLNELFTNFRKYLLVARMCEGEESILPIGTFTTSDSDWIVPDNFEEFQSAMLELSWIELGFPCTVDVPGLQAVLPKA